MANLNIDGFDLSTGAHRRLTAADSATRNDGTLVVDPTAYRHLASVTGIDLKTVATTNLFTVPTGKTAYITLIVLKVTTGTAITADAVAGVGIAAGEDDIFSSQTLLNTRASGDIWIFSGIGKARTATSASVVKLGVDTAATGTTLTVTADVYGVYDDDATTTNGLPGPFSCRVTRTGAQAIPGATATAVLFTSETFDNGNLHSTVTNTSRITVPVAGTYLFNGSIPFDTNGTSAGTRLAYIQKNGTTVLDPQQSTGTLTAPTYITTTSIINMASNDYVELIAYQESGGSLNISGTAGDLCFFEASLLPGQ